MYMTGKHQICQLDKNIERCSSQCGSCIVDHGSWGTTVHGKRVVPMLCPCLDMGKEWYQYSVNHVLTRGIGAICAEVNNTELYQR